CCFLLLQLDVVLLDIFSFPTRRSSDLVFIMVSFGDRIRALANSLGKDEQDVAKDLNLTKSRLSHYISGRTKVPSELLQKIVDTYKINPLFLFREDAPLYEATKKDTSHEY